MNGFRITKTSFNTNSNVPLRLTTVLRKTKQILLRLTREKEINIAQNQEVVGSGVFTNLEDVKKNNTLKEPPKNEATGFIWERCIRVTNYLTEAFDNDGARRGSGGEG